MLRLFLFIYILHKSIYRLVLPFFVWTYYGIGKEWVVHCIWKHLCLQADGTLYIIHLS